MSSRFLRMAAPLLILAGVVAACSGDDTAGSSGSVADAGNTSGSSGASGASGASGTSSSSSGNPELDSIITMTISTDWCQKPANQCGDAQSYTVDFVNSKLIATTCVELASKPDSGVGGTQNANTEHPLKSEQLDVVKKALANLRLTTYGADGGYANNAKRTLEIASKARGIHYFATSDTSCPKPAGDALSAGWEEIWTLVRGF